MIKFFRHIRQNLLAQGRIARYLTYAVGEILLVVIGIIIALQLNSWNENRINKKKEAAIVSDLNREFQKNKDKLDTTMAYHHTILGAISKVMRLIGEPEEVVLTHNTDSLIYLTIDYYDYSPGQSVISELISSGKLNLISSDTLRMFIFDWESAMVEMIEGYETMDEIGQSIMMPYLTRNASLKNIDQYGLGKVNGPSKFEPQNHKLFQDLEFENHMENQAWGVTNYLLKLERLDAIIDKILVHTEAKSPPQK